MNYENLSKALRKNLAGFVAHEMRTPLTTLHFYLELLDKARHIENPKERNEKINLFITKGKEAVNRTNFFIDSLLVKLHRLSTESNTDDLKPLSILDDITTALQSYPFTDKEKKLINLDQNNAFNYFGDSTLTVHIIYNLLSNALNASKATSKGEITIGFSQTKKANQLIFTDTAKGIAKDFLPNIFDAFVTSEIRKGAGLGLPYCKHVMKAYGGKIECNSQENKHTKFILSFPKLGK